MRAITLMIGITLSFTMNSQVNVFSGMELYTDTVTGHVFKKGYRTISEDNLGRFAIRKDKEKFTKDDFATVLNELERILILNGRTLNSYDEISIPNTVIRKLTADLLYESYINGRMNMDINYYYDGYDYQIIFSVDNIGTSKYIGISLGSLEDYNIFYEKYAGH